ncbi:MAG: S-methyl-5'-thioadenosine phosphorylase [Candidatus Pacearchaeota archaeon]
MKIGIIGGSGLDDPKLLTDYQEKYTDTPFGKPSCALVCGKLNGVEVVILARHGKEHTISPGNINYRANIYALKQEGCDYILATSAVGSLKEEIEPGNLVFPNQFLDFTKNRKNTFFEDEVKHTPMAEPYNNKLRSLLCDCCNKLGLEYHNEVTMVVIEGPRFSTKAESFMFRHLGADIIGMTGCPECSLANELGVPYQTIAMSTDYDCWKEDEEPVSFEIVLKRMKENADKVKQLLIDVVPKIASVDSDFIKSKIRTIPDFPKPGIMFRDITTLIKDSEGMNRVIEMFYNKYKDKEIDVVAGIESRGFIFGSILANKLGVGFVPIRKPGKLPGETIKQEYSLEYGKDAVEIHKDAIESGKRVLLIDDLLATSGTMGATCSLIERIGGEIIECAFVIELEDLGGRKKLEDKGYSVFSIVKFEGE